MPARETVQNVSAHLKFNELFAQISWSLIVML